MEQPEEDIRRLALNRIRSLTRESSQDVTLVHADAVKSKTTLTAEAQTRFLPYVALGTGVSFRDWSKAWLAAREAEELSFGSYALPSYSDREAGWTDAPMSSSEATEWLREFLQTAGAQPAELSRVGSHSCKSTMLTWAGRSVQVKFSQDERRLLGHHLIPGDRSMLTYSREAYTTLYGMVLAMYRLIESGEFDPDMTAVSRVLDCASAISQLAARETFRVQEEPQDCVIHRLSGVVHIVRLFYESHTLALSDLKQRVEAGPDQVMPSNKLVDQFVEMLESGVLVYLPPDACASRAQEIQCVKKDAAISLDGAGTLRLQSRSADPVVDAGTEVKLRAAWLRRSLAMDQAGLSTFQAVERWVQYLMQQLCKDQPKNFSRVTLQQIVECDKQLFTMASIETMGTLAAPPSGEKPLDAAIWLSARDQARVDSANILYSLTLEIALHCLQHNIVVSIENPKATKWLSTPRVYAALQAVCQNDHEHAPFGVTDSALWRRKALLAKDQGAVKPDHFKHLEDTAREGTEGKLRPIDDALECQLNSAYSTTLHLQLQDTDFVTALALEISKRVCQGRQRSRPTKQMNEPQSCWTYLDGATRRQALRRLSPFTDCSDTPVAILQDVSSCKPVQTSSDGAWKNRQTRNTSGGIGAVVVDQATDTRRVLSGEVPCELAELWSESVGLQAICEVELLAVVALREILGESLRDRRVIFWVDNESARFGLIKGISKSLPMQNLLHQFCELELGIPCFQWYERVPSASNCADGPSRQNSTEVCAWLGLQGPEPFEVPARLIQALVSE
ncbi:unnamed protein product [Effrenium voratum]|uniref:Uncharacterized protein n=1 Tax=Effrenium voratum TaxID=2562239 RepID=A0AA36NGX2_9DINO|nr:unnamed protein product [Effrenium voratum]